MNTGKRYAYVGICPKCDKAHAMSVSTFREREHVAKEVYDMILSGLRVRLMTVDEANLMNLHVCDYIVPSKIEWDEHK
jgi:hypothetical protein